MITNLLTASVIGVDLVRLNNYYLYKLKRANEIIEYGERVQKQIKDLRERIKNL
jgi:hypothetical protein